MQVFRRFCYLRPSFGLTLQNVFVAALARAGRSGALRQFVLLYAGRDGKHLCVRGCGLAAGN
jgi:hypothetical protein